MARSGCATSINGGTIKADQYTRQELMDNFGLSPFQVSNKSGLRLDTALSELGFVSKEQFNDPYFSQEDLVKDFLRKYNTNEKRKEFLDYDIDQKFIERLTPEEQRE